MPLWTRLRRRATNKSSSPPNTGPSVSSFSNPPTPGPHPIASRKIHPNLNALADELERESTQSQKLIPRRRSSPQLSRNDPDDIPMKPLRPRPRSRSLDMTSLIIQSPAPSSNHPPRPAHTHENDITITSSSHEDSNVQQDTAASSPVEHSRSPSATSTASTSNHGRKVLFKKTPDSSISKNSPAPPSAWQSTFGRKSRRIFPRLRSFGTATTSASPSTTGSSAHGTPYNSAPPSPSSFAKTFGFAVGSSPPPPMPTLDHPVFESTTHDDLTMRMATVQAENTGHKPLPNAFVLSKEYGSEEADKDKRGLLWKKRRKQSMDALIHKEPADAEDGNSHVGSSPRFQLVISSLASLPHCCPRCSNFAASSPFLSS